MVKNARTAYQTHLDVQKEEDAKALNRKRAREEEQQQKTTKTVQLAAIEDQLEEERHLLRASQNLIESGREKLDAAIGSVPLQKHLLIEAKSLIDIGTEKSEQSKTKIAEMEAKILKLKEK